MKEKFACEKQFLWSMTLRRYDEDIKNLVN